MQFKEAVIHNYKSIAKDCSLNLEGKITTLVGASESGKTNVLEAINKFFEGKAFQKSDICTFAAEGVSNDSYVVSALFELDETDDMEEIATVDKRLVTAGKFVIRKQKDGKYVLDESGLGERMPNVPQPTERIKELQDAMRLSTEKINNLLSEFLQSLPTDLAVRSTIAKKLSTLTKRMSIDGSQVYITEADWRGSLEATASLVGSISESIQGLENVPAEVKSVIEEMGSGLNESVSLNYETLPETEIDVGRLVDLCPHTIYVRDAAVQLLPNSIVISELESGDKKALLYQPLLDIAGLTVENLRDPDTTSRQRNLRSGKRKVDSFLRLWSQEKIEATFSVDADKFVFNVSGEEGHFGQLSDRSEGFQWFLAFCLAYWPLQSASKKSILLLDEPGLHLHASAQKDLLEQFENIARNNQIIYTTHSPFMINKNYPERIRAALKHAEPIGTSLDNKPYRATKGGCYEPIRTSIGITLGNSLFIGGCNLIVEGIADQILITAFSRYLAKQEGKAFIDLQDITITPAGGVDNIPYFAYLCNSEDMKSILLLDNDGEGDIAYGRIVKEGIFPEDRILRVQAAVVKKELEVKEIEDLIGAEYYHTAVSEAYKEISGAEAAKNLPSGYEELISQDLTSQSKQDPKENQGGNQGGTRKKAAKGKQALKGRTKVYSDFFKSKEWGGFDKALVARKISQKLDKEELPDDATTNNFERLCVKINNKIRETKA